MKRFLKNDGATLVELMVAIAVGSLITLAVTAVLLLGLRIHANTTGTVTRQNTARVVLSMLENLATEGTISKIESDPGSWKIHSAEGHVLASYDSGEGAVYSGDFDQSSAVAMLEGVLASNVSLNGKLLVFALETEEGAFSSTAYCRMAAPDVTVKDNAGNTVVEDLTDDDATNDTISGLSGVEKDARTSFLKTLSGQEGMRGGIIRNSQQYDGGAYKFFSEWYIGGYNSSNEAKGWSYNTPWCGCFISWGLTHYTGNGNLAIPEDRPKWFANVDEFMKYFQQDSRARWDPQTESGHTPVPGDLVFFNFISQDRNNPSHMGAVLSVEGGYVYTIEGNSADMVVVRRYALNDQRILGYGVLNWTGNGGA